MGPSATDPVRTSPIRPKRGEVSKPRVRRQLSLAPVTAPSPSVLVGDIAPAVVWERAIGDDPDSLNRINGRVSHRAQVGPVITEVEDVDKLFTGLEPRQQNLAFVEDWLVRISVRICNSDSSAVGKLELVQM